MKYNITEVREPPEAFDKDILALVSFEFEPSQFDKPIVFARYSKKSESTFPTCVVVGAKHVRIIDAQLRKSDKGHFWLSCNNVEDLDFKLLSAVAAEAMTWNVETGKPKAVQA